MVIENGVLITEENVLTASCIYNFQFVSSGWTKGRKRKGRDIEESKEREERSKKVKVKR